jgi:hypothetical protein
VSTQEQRGYQPPTKSLARERIRRKPAPQKCLCLSDLYASYLINVQDPTALLRFVSDNALRADLQAPL